MKGLNRRIITLLLLALGAISPVGSVYDAETNRMFTYVPYHFEAAEDGLELRGRFKPFYRQQTARHAAYPARGGNIALPARTTTEINQESAWFS